MVEFQIRLTFLVQEKTIRKKREGKETAKKEKEWERDGKEGEGMDWRENDEEAEHMAAVITVSTV